MQEDEIEITPQMLDAGFAELRSSGIADEYLEADRQLVGKIFAAMELQRSREVRNG